MLPNCIIIGAAKCGTTSLHLYLGRHPEIAMSAQKELNYFLTQEDLQRVGAELTWRVRHYTSEYGNLAWYRSQFDSAAPVRGEASPLYAFAPLVKDVPARIRSLLPDAKLIYVAGDPIARIRSQYRQELAGGRVHQLDHDLGDLERPDNPLVAASSYASQIGLFLEHFPLEQVLVVDQHELKHSRGETLAEVFRFLGVDESFSSEDFSEELNLGRRKVVLSATASSAWDRVIAPVGKAVLPARARARLRPHVLRALSRRDAGLTIPPRVLSSLRVTLGEEARRLRDLTGRSLSTWSV